MNNQPQIDSVMKIYTECIKVCSETIEKSNQINKRLVIAIVVIAVAFCISFSVMVCGLANLYFTSDYTYPQVNQNQFNTENSNQSINKGVN